MKIACIGNMNNNFFAITRYLRDRGLDVTLLKLNNEITHFFPEHDSFAVDHTSYVKNLDWGDVKSFYLTSAKSIARSVAGYDFIIACGSSAAFLNKIPRAIDLFIPYGTDIFTFPFRMHGSPNRFGYPILNFLARGFCTNQRNGLRNVKLISQEAYLENLKKILTKLSVLNKNYYLGFPMVYEKEYAPHSISQFYQLSKYYDIFREIRLENEFVVFHHSRHMWQDAGISQDVFFTKGNNLLIRAFARFVKSTNKKTKLILIEYGPNVRNSKELVAQLNIDSYVKWLPLMPRKEIMVGLSMVDVCAAEFSDGFYGYGVIWESLIAGKPIITHRDNSKIPDAKNTYPYFQANGEDQILEVLKELSSDPEKGKKLGMEGYEWVKSSFSKSIDKMVELIEAKQQNISFDTVRMNWEKNDSESTRL